MAGFKSQIISGCHIAVESSFPGEGTQEGALVEQERSLVGYHLPKPQQLLILAGCLV